jgi:E3 ubiquitin-protein ligase HUWE1
LKNNTEYNGYTQNSPIIRWLWEILENFDKQEKAAFIQFVTGTSKVPLEGFSQLRGMGGVLQKFMVHKAFDTNKLPTSHTWYIILTLGIY